MITLRLLLLSCCAALAVAVDSGLHLAVDASALPAQGLLRATLTVPASGGSLVLRYPQWIPGTHAPSGPVENLAGFTVHDDQGRVAPWNRDSRDPYRFVISVPEGAVKIVVDLVYIANQPSTNSEGVDVVAAPELGLINWNCCLLVPEGASISHLSCAASLTLPTGWAWASALHQARRTGDMVDFTPLMVDRLVDDPVLIGKTLDHFRLHAADERGPEIMLHVASHADDEAWRDERWLTCLRRLPDEANTLFAGAWHPHYDMLLVLGDEPMGLEHWDCSVNGIGGQASDFSQASAWQKELLPHEYVHSWVGKYRRPAGMLVDDYHTVPVQDSLWVYEGLTEHLGRVLAVRCGLISPGEWRTMVADNLREYAAMPGRRWRSIRDTCRSSHLLRDHSLNHADLRRGQDYYEEGALFWLAADLRIRADTHGARSLDDFCAAFFGPHGVHAPGYTEQDLVAALTAVCPGDWAHRIHRWIDETGDLDGEMLNGSGWHFAEGPAEPGEIDAAAVRWTALRDALGMVVSGGWVGEIVPESPAAVAGLQEGDYIFSVNGVERQKDEQVLEKAVLASPTQPMIILKVCRNRTDWSLRTITYAGGIHVARLVRVEGETDALAGILAPRAVAVAVPALSIP